MEESGKKELGDKRQPDHDSRQKPDRKLVSSGFDDHRGHDRIQFGECRRNRKKKLVPVECEVVQESDCSRIDAAAATDQCHKACVRLYGFLFYRREIGTKNEY